MVFFHQCCIGLAHVYGHCSVLGQSEGEPFRQPTATCINPYSGQHTVLGTEGGKQQKLRATASCSQVLVLRAYSVLKEPKPNNSEAHTHK